MARNSDAGLIGLLEIPLGSSRTGPTKRLVADLHEVAHQLDRVRNGVVRAWLRWREDHADWVPPQMADPSGKPKFNRKGEPIYVSPMHPVVVADDGSVGEFERAEDDGSGKRRPWKRKGDGADGVGFETWLYHRAREIEPRLDSQLVVAAVREVLSNLKTDVQHHHKTHRERWQAVLAHDESVPTFRARTIPVPNNSAYLCCGDGISGGKNGTKADRERVRTFGVSGCAVSLPLFSASASREFRSPVVMLNVGKLSPGNRQVVRRVATGEWTFSDSKLVFKKNRWQIQLTYRQPGEDLQLDKNRLAEVWPQFGDAYKPFMVSLESFKSWQCGHGKLLVDEFKRLETRRIMLRNRYKVALSGVKGHGRKRFEYRLKPWSRHTQNHQKQFTEQLVQEIVRFCKTFNCGSVMYHEPTIGIRDRLWFGVRDVPYDWTNLMMALSHTLRYYHIDLVECSQVNGRDLRERFGAGESADPARKPQGDEATKVGGAAATGSRFMKNKGKAPLANGRAKPNGGNGYAAKGRNGKK